MFDESTLGQIRERIDIVELIQGYVPLKRSGTGMTGLCPFHKEKSPSFHVHPLKQIYHCFGCHSGGNIFTFLMNVEGLRFPEAVERLAKKAGVEIQNSQKAYVPQKPRIQPGDLRLIEANELAAKFYHWLLWNKPEYAPVRKYVESRGLTIETCNKFRIGVAPDDWSTLKDWLKKKGFTAAELTAAGLVIQSTDGKNDGYDRFRGRLMFPITDSEGQVVGFGARLLPGKEGQDKQPKYLNSPETNLFSKKNTLYALHENQRGIRLKGEAVLVEGYMDVVGLYDKGVDNAVATMGTAFTEDHCRRLAPLTKRVVTVFDPDEAGRDAWRRSIPIFLDAGFVARDLKLPDERDPDEFVQEAGAEKFYELVEQAPRQDTQLLKEISAQGAMSEEQKGKWLERLTPILISSRNRTERALLWDNVGLLLGLSPQSIMAHVEKQLGQKQTSDKTNPAPAGPRRPIQPTSQVKKDTLGRAYLKLALWYPAEFLKNAGQKFSDEIKEVEVARLVSILEKEMETQGPKAVLEAMMKEVSDPELAGAMSEAVLNNEAEIPRAAPLAVDIFPQVIKDLTRRRKEKLVQQLTTQVKLAQRLGQEEETLKLLEAISHARQEVTSRNE